MSCRLCLKRCKNMVLLTSNDNLKTKIKDYLNIDVSCNELPKNICSECYQKIEEFSSFQQNCCRSDRILRNAMKSNTLHIFFDSETDIEQFEKDPLKSEEEESEGIYNENSRYLDSNDSNNTSDIDPESEDNAIVIEETSDLDFILSDFEGAFEIEKIIVKHENDDERDFRFGNVKSDIGNKEGSNFGQSDDALKMHFICKECKNEFNSDKEFLSHQQSCFGSSQESDSKCYICGEIFHLKEDLQEHTKRHLSHKLEYNFGDVNVSDNELCKDQMKVKCPLCTKIMLKQSLKQHLVKHTDRFKCPKCPARSSSKANLWVHVKSTHTKIKDFTCMLCGKKFAHAALLKIHMKSHSNLRLYKCQLCDYAGRTSSALRTHNQSHQTERPHLCDLCAKMYKTISELRLHKRRTHLEERKNKCHICGQAFFKKYKLEVHMRSHTGEKPYTCKICNKNYRRSDSLREHMRTHEKLYHKCDKCYKEFLSKRSIKWHACD